jgi:hypothetical protein
MTVRCISKNVHVQTEPKKMPDHIDGEFKGSTKARLQMLAESQQQIASKIEILHREAVNLIEVQRERITQLETWRATLTARIAMLVGAVCTVGTLAGNWIVNKIGG